MIKPSKQLALLAFVAAFVAAFALLGGGATAEESHSNRQLQTEGAKVALNNRELQGENLGLCTAQAKCIDFTIRKTDGTMCELTGNCGIEVCMILDTGKEGCAKEGAISHLCAASDSTGCAAYDTDGVTPLTGKGGSDYCALTGEDGTNAFDGKCEPCPSQTRIVMCQEAEPGQTVYWALKDGDVADTSVYDYTGTFTYEIEGTTCNSPLIQCAGDTGLQCADPQNDMHESTRVWSYQVPASDGGDCDLCAESSATVTTTAATGTGEIADASVEIPDWLWLACGRGKGGCGDTFDFQDTSSAKHELRCCASEKLGPTWMTNGGACSSNWHESNLIGLDDSTNNCFHRVNYTEAVAICAKNNAEVCSKQQIEDGCARGSGCGHDADLIWTSDAAPERTPPPPPVEKDPEDWLWLSCGRPGRCGSPGSFQAQAKEKHEVRCCSSFPIGGWLKNRGCSIWTESDLLGDDGTVQCFHEETYADAQAICALNGAYVCTKEEVEAGCAAGSGCGHDADPIWTSNDAPERIPPPPPVEKDPEDWLWLSCGRPGACGAMNEFQAQAKERHEVRCCSSFPVSGWRKNAHCSVWTESDLFGDGRLQCFHGETYADAQMICENNGGRVCSKEEVDAGCTRGSGCGHDADLVWTSTDATAPEPIVFPNQDTVDPEDWIWLSCGRGKHLCGIGVDIQIQAGQTAELRCCSPVPVSGWKKNGASCDVWHESDLIGADGREQCFHDVTYAEGQEICALNGGHVCTKEQVESGCAKGSGCGHDGDLIWTGAPAPSRTLDDLPYQDPIDSNEWLWLSCGRGGHKCGIDFDVAARADEGHEVRCCSDYPIEGWRRTTKCENWHQSKLTALDGTPGTCFHDSTYAEAQAICRANGGYVCSQDQVKAGCARGSGCGHDADFIWTSTGPATPRPAVEAPVPVPDDFHLFLACGAGENGCGGEAIGVSLPTERHEVRCCSNYPLNGWKKGGGQCTNYHESDLTALDGTPNQCFHSSTYAEAQEICYANNAQVCTATEVLDQCARGSGCGHDGDLVWTRTEATAEAVAAYKTKKTQAALISGVCVEAKGRISGDPHFSTFDNYRYDCQGHGEFVIAMSKGSDPLAIHGRFVRVTESRIKPTITKSVAIKVVDEVPAIQVTAPPQKINGKCPFTFTIGEEETPLPAGAELVKYLDDTYGGAVKAFTNGKNIIFTFEEVHARIQITGGGGGNRCVLNTNLCLTPESHGGPENIVGLLGSPDGNKDNDWMNRNGTITPLPEACNIPNPTSSEKKHCRTQRNIKGHEWCMDNWCIGHANNSLWGEASHAEYNECENRQPDTFFENVEEADPAIVEACEDAEDPEGCVIDTIIAVEDGQDIQEFVDTVLDEDADANFTESLGERDPTTELDGWDGPVQDTNVATIEDEIPEDAPETTPDSTPDTTPTGGTDSTQISDSSGSLGDPHFKTWIGEHFEYHGQCDMVLTRDHNFADGIGLEVQIRTKLVRFWSYIKRAAIRIGDDILEVEGVADTGNDKEVHYWFNFEYTAEAKTIGGFPLTIVNNRAKKRLFEIDLSSKFPGQKIVVSSFREFVRVDFQHTTAEAFGNTVGMMGDFKTGTLLARDGVKEIDDFLDFGNEWQLLPSDDMLFHDKSEPQFPKRCILPEDPQGERRRRLGESTIPVEEAEAACSKVLGDKLDIKDCVYDILATQNIDMVGAF